MRVNVYAEEMTDRIEVIVKEADGKVFTGLRFYLELPVSLAGGATTRGPFMHRAGDDDSSAVTFWASSPAQLTQLLRDAVEAIEDDIAEGERLATKSGEARMSQHA